MKAKRKRGHSTRDPDATSPPRLLEGGVDAAAPVDRVIHQPVRLSIVSVLAVNDVVSFNELKQLLELSDGNLSVHARKLENAGYVACDKKFVGRVPRTQYRLTTSGRRALERYLAHMEALIESVRRP